MIRINDDGPLAVDDTASTAEDTAVTVNVISNDTAGADGGKALVSATLATLGAGSISVNTTTGEVTFTPAAGFEGTATIDYVMQDGEGDTDAGQLVITVDTDSTPTVSWVLAGPGVVDEGALPGGNLGGNISTSGTLTISTSGDEIKATGGVVINGVDVTAGGTVNGTYGALVVTVAAGVYSWTYTLSDNAPHTNTGAVGSGDQLQGETFAVVVTDDDGDVAPTANLVIRINDDGPLAVTPATATLTNGAGSTVTGVPLDTGSLVIDNYGADGGKVRFDSNLPTTVTGTVGTEVVELTSSGRDIFYELLNDGLVLVAKTDLGTVFTVTLNPDTGTYDVVMVGTVDGGQDEIDFDPDGDYDFTGGNGPWAGFTSVELLSQDLLLTPLNNGQSSGTVNTNNNLSGIDNPTVGASEGMRLDFVIDLTGDPGSGGDYSTPARQNHLFSGHYETNGSAALISVGGSGSSNIKFSAYDDDDSGTNPNAVGDGIADEVIAISILYNGRTELVAKPEANLPQTVTVTFGTVPNQVVMSVSFDALSATVTGVLDGTSVGVYTANGYTTLEYTHAGGSAFSIAGFGGAPITPGVDVSLELPLVVTDGDGDAVGSTISLLLEAQDPTGTTSLSAASLFATEEPMDEGLLTQSVLGMQAIEPEGESTTEPVPEPGSEEAPPPATEEQTSLDAGLLEPDPSEPVPPGAEPQSTEQQQTDLQQVEPLPSDPQQGEPLLAADLLDGGIEELPLPGQDEPGAGRPSDPSADIQTYEASLWPTASELPRNTTDPT